MLAGGDTDGFDGRGLNRRRPSENYQRAVACQQISRHVPRNRPVPAAWKEQMRETEAVPGATSAASSDGPVEAANRVEALGALIVQRASAEARWFQDVAKFEAPQT